MDNHRGAAADTSCVPRPPTRIRPFIIVGWSGELLDCYWCYRASQFVRLLWPSKRPTVGAQLQTVVLRRFNGTFPLVIFAGKLLIMPPSTRANFTVCGRRAIDLMLGGREGESERERERDAVRLASLYVPSSSWARGMFLQRLEACHAIGPDTIVQGDMNCVATPAVDEQRRSGVQRDSDPHGQMDSDLSPS